MQIARRLVCIAALFAIAAFASAAANELEDALKRKLLGKDSEQTRTDLNKKKAPAADRAKSQAPEINLFDDVSDEEELALGQHIAGNLLGAAPPIRDAELQRYINQVGRWVALQSERADLSWTFAVIDSADINAFAIPGGYVFVTSGLYRILQDEAELAGVLGHEIAHIVRRHHIEVLKKSQLLGAGAELLTRKLGDEKGLQRLIGSGAEIMSRGLDKSAEFEADRMGVVLAARAGYDPYALISVLQRIGERSGGDSSTALLFKTHPHPDARLEKLAAAIGNRFDRLGEGKLLAERFVQLQ